MNNQAKQLYEKMVDFKRFAVVLLAVGAFFYLGVIIPSDIQNTMDVNIIMAASTFFIGASLFLFVKSKQYHTKLLKLEEDHEYIRKNKHSK